MARLVRNPSAERPARNAASCRVAVNRAEHVARVLAKDVAKLSHIGAVTAHTADTAQAFGTVPAGTPEFSRHCDRWLGMGYVAPNDPATGACVDPGGRTQASHNAQVGRLLKLRSVAGAIKSVIGHNQE